MKPLQMLEEEFGNTCGCDGFSVGFDVPWPLSPLPPTPYVIDHVIKANHRQYLLLLEKQFVSLIPLLWSHFPRSAHSMPFLSLG